MSDPANLIVGCNAVIEHISSDVPPTLWHYTSFEGMRGIVTSKSIWATEYRFLNDKEELLHAKSLALTLIEEEPDQTGLGFPAKDALRQAVELAFGTGPLHESRMQVMVASFSEASDQLSQWRGYSANSTGISLGLDLRARRPPLEINSAVTFAPCVYEDSKKRLLLKSVFANFRGTLQEQWWDPMVVKGLAQHHEGKLVDFGAIQQFTDAEATLQIETLRRAHECLRLDLLRVAPLLKDEGFAEEKEWRLVLPRENINFPAKHQILYRSTANCLVPYVAFPLNSPGQEGPILCSEIILGPGCHASAKIGVDMFLLSQQIPIESRLSKIPYRPA